MLVVGATILRVLMWLPARAIDEAIQRKLIELKAVWDRWWQHDGYGRANIITVPADTAVLNTLYLRRSRGHQEATKMQPTCHQDATDLHSDYAYVLRCNIRWGEVLETA